MRDNFRIWAAAAATLVLAVSAWAETVVLRTGESLTGDVQIDAGGKIVVTQRFPDVKQVILSRDELNPESLFDVLDRRTQPGDAARRKELGEMARDLGLHGRAVAEFRAVKELDASQAKAMDAQISMLLEAIALDVLDEAKALLDAGKARASLMYLHTLRERYPATSAGREAETLMPRATKAAGATADVAPRTVDVDEVPKTIAAVEAHLAKGCEVAEPLRGHTGSTVKEQRAAERAVEHFERAWEVARTLPVTASDDATARRIRAARDSSRSELVNALLTAGTIHLQRRSVPSAESYCNRACEIDPENKANHALHRLVLDAKSLSYGRGGASR